MRTYDAWFPRYALRNRLTFSVDFPWDEEVLHCRLFSAAARKGLSENEAENLQNGDVHLAQIPDFEMGYLENH